MHTWHLSTTFAIMCTYSFLYQVTKNLSIQTSVHLMVVCMQPLKLQMLLPIVEARSGSILATYVSLIDRLSFFTFQQVMSGTFFPANLLAQY